jgi:hypothetical protein
MNNASVRKVSARIAKGSVINTKRGERPCDINNERSEKQN